MSNGEQSAQSQSSDYLTVEEAAGMIRMPLSSFRQHVYSGEIEAYRPGRRVLVKRASLLAFVERARIGAR
jgi:excisionase family DNA binding protein